MAEKSLQLTTANYNKGTWIMIEGKKDADAFFIIRKGSVRLVKENENIVEEQGSDVLKPGDFFGVISCMSGHPRIESAVALSDVSLIVVKKHLFGVLIQKNAPIALKIIRSFSMKLRTFDEALTKLSFQQSIESDPKELYNIGLYYLNAKNNNLAVYPFYKVLKLVKDDKEMLAKAKKQFEGLKKYAREALNLDQPKEGFTRSFSHNTFIFCEHEPGNELYIIQGGKVKITKIVAEKEVMLAVLNPGDIFGEMAILDNKPRSASAIAEGSVQMFAVNRQNFEGMVTKQPQLATKLITLLAERIWLIYRQLANIMLKDPTGRLYDTLLTQLLKHKIEIKKAAKHIFDFGVSDLLRMTGLDPVADRVVADPIMKSSKFKLAEGGKVQCNDIEEIQKQVNYYKKMQLMEQKRNKKKQSGL